MTQTPYEQALEKEIGMEVEKQVVHVPEAAPARKDLSTTLVEVAAAAIERLQGEMDKLSAALKSDQRHLSQEVQTAIDALDMQILILERKKGETWTDGEHKEAALRAEYEKACSRIQGQIDAQTGVLRSLRG